MTQKTKTQKTKQSGATGTSYPAERLDPLRLIAQLPLHPYQVLADFRCGSGHFTIPLAKHLFDGKLYATDSSADALEELKQNLTKSRLTNVVVGKEEAIPPETLDGVLLAFALYRMRNKKSFLRNTLGLLKKGSWIAVLEWYERETPDGPPMSARIGEAAVVELAREVGFRFSEKRNFDGRHYLVMLRK